MYKYLKVYLLRLEKEEYCMKNSIQLLEESIADKIKNYQKHLNYWEFDDRHVDIWIKQFPEEEREIVLTETDSLLAHNYIKKGKIKEFFEEIWDTKEIMGENPIMSLNQIQFLDIQTKGHSQNRLIDLLEEYYQETKGAAINRSNHKDIKKYIYIDDCMYTGFTLMKDIYNWVDNMNPNSNTQLDVIFLGEYNGNLDYVKGRLITKCNEKKIAVKIYWMYEYNNNLHYAPPYDVLWPQYMDDDEYVNSYVQYMEEQKKNTGKGGLGFRNSCPSKESNLFTSSYNRAVLEKALLKKGAYICSLPQNCNERMKPMGYSHGISLGYGAFFATCYNISNNCPLAFWWGNLSSSPSETLGKWYPLLPREVN